MSIVFLKSPENTILRQFAFEGSKLLSELMQEGELYLAMPCAGNHRCGKCKVLAAGCLLPPSQEERALLSPCELADGVRLACFAQAVGDVTLQLAGGSGGAVLTDNAGTDGIGDTGGFQIAVDIGTTTIVSYLYQGGKQLSAVGEMNQQGKFGADVISRIERAEGNNTLQETIVGQLDRMLRQNIRGYVAPERVEALVVTGNTTMLHFLMGYDSFGIAVHPFLPHSLFNESHPARELFPAFTAAALFLPPCISAYVGADMVCAILASGMMNRDETSILADIGTNGEMALAHHGRLFTCSTAAGPAFEGANIRMGMTASAGAVDDAWLEGDSIAVHTIENAPAQGICGSGLLNVAALLLRMGILDEYGLLLEEGHPFSALLGEDEEGAYVRLGESGVVLTQKDIRQLQLAKSAIHAGILTLARECRVDLEAVRTLYLCGGFGSFIDPENAAAIALIPRQLADRVKTIGNGAGRGACMMLSEKQRQKGVDIAARATEIPLSSNAFFMEEYVNQMLF